jgi:PAS domain-containing protein
MGELLVIAPAGIAVLFTSLSVGCVRKADGSVDYVLALLEDISERRQAAQALRESKEKYQGIFDESVAAIYVFDGSKKFIDHRFSRWV